MTQHDEVSVPGLPDMVRASELPTGRRRRRSAIEPSGSSPSLPLDEPEEHPEPPERAERARGRKGRARERPEETADPEARAREICLRLLTGTAKTRKQLAEALARREIPPEVAESVLDRLTEVGLIDDAAFAAAWVEARHAGRGLARRALAQELRTKGVADELVQRAVARVEEEDETEAARALVGRKLGGTRGLPRDTRIRRLVAVLARRGYSEGLAFRVVRQALDEEGD